MPDHCTLSHTNRRSFIRRVLVALHIAVVTLATMACAFGDDADAIGLVTANQDQVLWVVGRYNNTAALWQITDRFKFRFELPNPSGPGVQGEAMSCTFANGILYASGWVDYFGSFRPCLWINGVPMVFDSLGFSSFPNGLGLAVRNGHFVVAGIAGSTQACIWYDGVPMLLPQSAGATNSMAYAVKFWGDQLVVGGMNDMAAISQACYWIDGALVPLGNFTGERITDIDIYGGAIYGTGPSNNNTTVSNWLGLVPVVLQGFSPNTTRIRMLNGVPFNTGLSHPFGMAVATIWVNGVPMYPAGENTQSTANGLLVVDNYKGFSPMIIASGAYMDGANAAACIWMNGSLTKLDSMGGWGMTVANDVCLGSNIEMDFRK